MRTKSTSKSSAENQLSLQFEPGLARKFKSLRRCVSTTVYAFGFDRCALAADESPGNFSKSLSDRHPNDSCARRFDIDALEAVLDETHDYTPIYYLIDKYLRDDQARRDEAIHHLGRLLPELTSLLKQAGVA